MSSDGVEVSGGPIRFRHIVCVSTEGLTQQWRSEVGCRAAGSGKTSSNDTSTQPGCVRGVAVNSERTGW